MTISAINTNEKSDQFVTISSLPEITGSNCIVTTNSGMSISGISSLSHPHISLQKSDGTCIDVDNIITTEDLTSTSFLWESLFLAICKENPREASEYMTTLKLYNEDYKSTVIAIETAKKEE